MKFIISDKAFVADFGNFFRPSTNRKEEGIFRKAAVKFIDEQVKHKKPSFHIMDKPFGERKSDNPCT